MSVPEQRAMCCWAMRDNGATWRQIADWLGGSDLAWTEALTFALERGRRPYELASSPPSSLSQDVPVDVRNVRAEEGARLLDEGLSLAVVSALLEYPTPAVARVVIDAERRDRAAADRGMR